MNDFFKLIVIPLIVGISSTLVTAHIMLKAQKEMEVTLNQFEQITQSLWELEFYLSELMDKNNIPAGKENSLIPLLSDAELNNVNNLILKFNVALGKLYFIMPDNKYLEISKVLSLDPKKLKMLREELMLKMRKNNYPHTKLQLEDIRFLHRISKGK